MDELLLTPEMEFDATLARHCQRIRQKQQRARCAAALKAARTRQMVRLENDPVYRERNGL